jgi:hypothetical protein
MTRTSCLALGAPLLALMLAASSMGQPPLTSKVTVQTMTYAELGKTIRGFKGKVVVVDFWATT